MAECCIKARVHGSVQGVGFRYSTQREAKARGLKGYARNLDDGSVEVLVCGEEDAVQDLIRWLKAGGPRSASVESAGRTLSAARQTQRLHDGLSFTGILRAWVNRRFSWPVSPGLSETTGTDSGCFPSLRHISAPWLSPASARRARY